MANTMQTSDKGYGLSITFGVVAVLAAVGMLGTSYLYALNGAEQMQLYSGFAFAVAMGAGAIAIAALHMYN